MFPRLERGCRRELRCLQSFRLPMLGCWSTGRAMTLLFYHVDMGSKLTAPHHPYDYLASPESLYYVISQILSLFLPRMAAVHRDMCPAVQQHSAPWHIVQSLAAQKLRKFSLPDTQTANGRKYTLDSHNSCPSKGKCHCTVSQNYCKAHQKNFLN